LRATDPHCRIQFSDASIKETEVAGEHVPILLRCPMPAIGFPARVARVDSEYWRTLAPAGSLLWLLARQFDKPLPVQ